MSEIRMEVLSESEALEICEANRYKFVKVYEGRGHNAGRLMMLAFTYKEVDQMSLFEDNVNKPKKNKTKKSKKDSNDNQLSLFNNTYKKTGKYRIRTVCNGSYMYIGRHGTTFIATDAMIFDEEAAKKKAYFMSKRGSYTWEAVRIE